MLGGKVGPVAMVHMHNDVFEGPPVQAALGLRTL